MGKSTAPGDAQEAAEAPTVLDTLARAPAAAALVFAALDQLDDRRALRLAHSQLRDAVGEATTKLTVAVDCEGFVPTTARPPTPGRWPRLGELTVMRPDLAALEALGAETWAGLRTLNLGEQHRMTAFDAPSRRRCGGCPRCARSSFGACCCRMMQRGRCSAPRAPTPRPSCARSVFGARISRRRQRTCWRRRAGGSRRST